MRGKGMATLALVGLALTGCGDNVDTGVCENLIEANDSLEAASENIDIEGILEADDELRRVVRAGLRRVEDEDLAFHLEGVAEIHEGGDSIIDSPAVLIGYVLTLDPAIAYCEESY